jgi:hypothetical protein
LVTVETLLGVAISRTTLPGTMPVDGTAGLEQALAVTELAMRRVLLLAPIVAASWLLIGLGTLMYGLFVDSYVTRLGAKELRLSDSLTYVCVGFTASWCDVTSKQGDLFPTVGPLKVCGPRVISHRPTTPVVIVPDENALACRPKRVRPAAWLLFLGFAVPFFVAWKIAAAT